MQNAKEDQPTKKAASKVLLLVVLLAVCGFIVVAGSVAAFLLLKDSPLTQDYGGTSIPSSYQTYNQGGVKFGYPENWQAEGAFGFIGAGPEGEEASQEIGVIFVVSTDEDQYDKVNNQECDQLEEEADFDVDTNEGEFKLVTSKKVEVNGAKGCVFEGEGKDGEEEGTAVSYMLADKDSKRVASIVAFFVADADSESKDHARKVARTFEFTEAPEEEDGFNLDTLYDDFGTLDNESSEDAPLTDEEYDQLLQDLLKDYGTEE